MVAFGEFHRAGDLHPSGIVPSAREFHGAWDVQDWMEGSLPSIALVQARQAGRSELDSELPLIKEGRQQLQASSSAQSGFYQSQFGF